MNRRDFDDPPRLNEGAVVGLVILFFIYFVAGLAIGALLGAWLW